MDPDAISTSATFRIRAFAISTGNFSRAGAYLQPKGSRAVKRLKRVLKWSGAVLGAAVVFLGGFLAWLWFVPPASEEPTPRKTPDHSAYLLDEKVGWYRSDDGSERLITWGADGALTIADLQKCTNDYLQPETATRFGWRNRREKQTYRVEFRRNAAGAINGFGWTSAERRDRSARRLEAQPYAQSDVRFAGRDITLAGLLLTPAVSERRPAVALVHGSGVSDRDLLWYVVIADSLARRGFIVLLPDKRGCGKSGGQWHTSSFDDYAEDAVAAVEYLKGLDVVDARRIGLIGMSQGGFIVPLAAARSRDIAFIVSFSGSASTIRDTMRHEISCDMSEAGVPDVVIPFLEPVYARRAMKSLPDFWRINGAFDPIESWRRLSAPALVLNGGKDRNLPVSASLARLEEVRRGTPALPVTIHVYPDSGHGLNVPGQPRIRDEVLAEIAEWIERQPPRGG